MPALRRHRAFTMLELMTVIAIIILVLAMAVPVVRSIEGTRSVEAGYNRVSAAIGHARQIALFNRAPAGVVFFKYGNGNSPEVLAFVQQFKVLANNSSIDDRYMEIIPGEEIVTMPPGVGVQLLSPINPVIAGSSPAASERYLRAGIIMFDENGQLVTNPYLIPTNTVPIPNAALPELGAVLGVPATGASVGFYSSPAICLYDDDAYRSQVDSTSGSSFAQNDDVTNSFDTYVYASSFGNPAPIASTKVAEINWLDQNGETLVIKPNDGSLLRNQ